MKEETLNTTQIAAALGISRQRVNQLAAKGKIAREAGGGWNLEKVRSALAKNLDMHQKPRSISRQEQQEPPERSHDQPAPAARRSDEDKPITLTQAQIKNELAKASKTEFEVGKLRGILVDAEEVETEWERHINAAREHALQLPSKLAPKVAVESDVLICQHIIEREVRSFLTELSQYNPNA